MDLKLERTGGKVLRIEKHRLGRVDPGIPYRFPSGITALLQKRLHFVLTTDEGFDRPDTGDVHKELVGLHQTITDMGE